MITILALGLASIVLMLGFAVFKICKLITVVDKEQKYTGNFYLIISIILFIIILIAWAGESGYMRYQ